MPASLRVVLTPEESEMLSELRVATTVPQRTRDRAHLIRLNAEGWNTPDLAEIFEIHPHTVRSTIKRWQAHGLTGLWEAPGRGAKRRWSDEDLACLERWVNDDSRTYNSAQLARKLKEERKVELSRDRVRKILKKNDYHWKRTRHSHRQKQDPVARSMKQADLDMLEFAAAAGDIDLKYLDESGFSLWSPVSYSYSRRGEQKRMEQTKMVHGSRVSILGLWESGKGFEYGLAKGAFNSLRYIELMNWVAEKAAKTFAETGKLTVIVQDNGSLHKSKITQAQWARWEQQGLIMFFLPPYCSEMNPIEGEWHQLKAHGIAGQMFETIYDLGIVIETSIEERYESKDYNVERFIFKSA
jgi:transposase